MLQASSPSRTQVSKMNLDLKRFKLSKRITPHISERENCSDSSGQMERRRHRIGLRVLQRI